MRVRGGTPGRCRRGMKVDCLLLARLLLWLRNGHIKLVAADHASMRRRYVPCNGIFGHLVELRSEGCRVARHAGRWMLWSPCTALDGDWRMDAVLAMATERSGRVGRCKPRSSWKVGSQDPRGSDILLCGTYFRPQRRPWSPICKCSRHRSCSREEQIQLLILRQPYAK